MLKPQTISILESNIANFGTEIEFKVKKASAEGEPEFKQFANPKSGTYLWRVRNFKLEPCFPDDVANFFRGDSYLAVSIVGTGASKTFDIFFWIGDQTTLDEAGTAAYKAFELDNVLNQKAIQHREVYGEESDKFMKLFPSARFLEGGYDSGFHHVKAEEHKTRLFRVHEDSLREVPTVWGSLRSDGIFILDCGSTVYQWTGDKAPSKLKAVAMQAVRYLDDSRDSNVNVVTLAQDDNCREFALALGSPGGKVEEVSTVVNLPLGRNRSLGALRITKYDGKFSNVDVRESDGAIYIEDNGSRCLVYGKLPVASFCVMAYFNWAGRPPCAVEFAR